MANVSSLSGLRPVPEAVSSGPAGGQLVPQLLISREDNEVIQLHTGQQSPSAPDIHARHVVSVPNGASQSAHISLQTTKFPWLLT